MKKVLTIYTLLACSLVFGLTVTPTPTSTPKPTTKPTSKPTSKPTATPTATPTAKPTTNPSPACTTQAVNDIDIKVNGTETKIINVLVNDRCVQKCATLSFTQAAHGKVSVDDAGTQNDLTDDTLLYTLKSGTCVATDSFEYTVKDCKGASTTAAVTLKIDCTNAGKSEESSGDTLNAISIFFMMFLTSMIAILFIRKENI